MYLLNKSYLLNTYNVLGPIVDYWDSSMKRTNKDLYLHGVYILAWKERSEE